VHLFVESELLLVEREAREQAILVEQIIGDAYRREQVLLAQRRELLGALNRK